MLVRVLGVRAVHYRGGVWAMRKVEPRAVVTESGYIVKGDSDDRPGDPIFVTHVNRVEIVAAVLPSNKSYAGPYAIQEELELYEEADNA